MRALRTAPATPCSCPWRHSSPPIVAPRRPDCAVRAPASIASSLPMFASAVAALAAGCARRGPNAASPRAQGREVMRRCGKGRPAARSWPWKPSQQRTSVRPVRWIVRQFRSLLRRQPVAEEEETSGRAAGGDVLSTTALDLQQLAEHLSAAECSLEGMEGQNVVALIGRTGTGKTTFLQAAAGRALRRRQYARRANGTCLKVVFEAEDPLEGFEIGHGQTSQTKQMKYYKRMPPKLSSAGSQREPVFYLDTPGYEDTAGIQVDIATSVLLRKVAQLSGKLRFCVFVSCVSFEESRGGAVRDVAKLISRFTSDFQQHRLAFTFIFTHGEALSATRNLKPRQLKAQIRGWLEETSQGTRRDSTEWTILQWMIECLKQDYHYVCVFLPKHSNVPELLEAIERFEPEEDGTCAALGLRPGVRPGDVVRCGILPPKKSKIQLELRKLHQQLKSDLDTRHLAGILEKSATLKALHQHIELPCVREALETARTMVQDEKAKLWNGLHSLCGRSVAVTDDFGVQDARELLQVIHHLKELEQVEIGGPSSQGAIKCLDHIHEDLHEQLLALQSDLHTTFEESLALTQSDQTLRQLERLHVWKRADSHFAPLWHQSREDAESYLQRAVASVHSAVDPAISVVWLAQLKQNLQRLHNLGLQTRDIGKAFEQASKRVRRSIEDDFDTASKALETMHQSAEYHEHAEHLEDTIDKLRGAIAPVEGPLLALAQTRWRNLTDQAQRRIESQHDAAVSAAAHGQLGQPLAEPVQTLEVLSRSLTARQGEECCIESRVDFVLQKAEATVWKKMQAAGHLLEEARAGRGFGGALERHASLMSTLLESTWLDTCLAKEERFVVDRVRELQEDYRCHLKALTRTVWESLLACLNAPCGCGCGEDLERLENLWPVVAHMDALDGAVPGAARRQRRLFGLIRRHSKEFCRQHGHVLDAPGEHHEPSVLPAKKLEKVLAVCNDLKFVLPAKTDFMALDENARKRLEAWCAEVKKLMNAPTYWKEKGAVLDAVALWEGWGLQRVFDELRKSELKPEGLRMAVRKTVEAEASRIRDLLAADAPDLESVETAMNALKDAQVVYKETSGHIEVLTQILEMRRNWIDEALSQKIKDCRFEGLYDRFKPLIGSKDIVKQVELDRLLGLVKVRIEAELSLTNITDPLQLTATLKALGKIDDGLRSLLLQHSSLDISAVLQAVREDARNHFKQLLQQLQAAHDASSLAAIVKTSRAVRKYHAAATDSLDSDLRAQADTIITSTNNLPEGVRANARALCDCLVGKTEEFAEPIGVLQNLRAAISDESAIVADKDEETAMRTVLRISENWGVTDDNLTLQKLADCYDDAIKLIKEQFNEIHAEVSRVVEEYKLDSIAIVVYTRMEAVCQGGLRDHLQNAAPDVAQELPDVAQELEAARERSQRWKQRPDSPDDIGRWAAMLEELGGMTTLERIPLWNDDAQAKEYTRLKEQLREHVEAIVGELKSTLHRREYRKAAHCVVLATHAQCLRQHLDQTTLESLNSLKEPVEQGLHELSQGIRQALRHNEVLKFETLFSRSRSLRRHLGPLFPELTEACLPLHKEIADHIHSLVTKFEDHLRKWDFASAAESTELVRRFGPFLTGAYVEYRRELEPRRHAEDQALRRLDGLSKRLFDSTDAALGELYALLELPPGTLLELSPVAIERDIQAAFTRMLDSDACPDIDQLRHVKDQLLDPQVRERYRAVLELPLSSDIAGVPPMLRDEMRDCLREHGYERCAQLLSKTDGLHILGGLAVPPLKSEEVRDELRTAVLEHVNELRCRAQHHWERRMLTELQKDLAMRDRARENLGKHLDIYTGQDVMGEVREEIADLARQASQCLNVHGSDPYSTMRDFAFKTICLAKIMYCLPPLKDFARTKLHLVLDECQEKVWGPFYLFQLGNLLQQGKVGKVGEDGTVDNEDQRMAKMLVKEFRHFKDVRTMVWNDQTAGTQLDVSSTLDSVAAWRVVDAREPLAVDKDELHKLFEQYQAEYDKHFLRWCAEELTLEELVRDVVRQAVSLQPCRAREWTPRIRAAVPRLLAGICAYFTISESGDSYRHLTEAEDGESASGKQSSTTFKADRMLVKPHAIQVVGVLRLLGIDVSDGTLKHQLLQVRTGEGKSLLLGCCSVLLGLLGFRVRCVCYSEYLSQRDYRFFQEIFERFGVTDRVVYSTITGFSEDSIESRGDLRSMTVDLFDCTASPKQPSTSGGKSVPVKAADRTTSSTLPPLSPDADEVLLIDEVEVLFGKEFYGRTHNLVAGHASQEVEQLFHEVWALRSQAEHPAAFLKSMQSSEPYGELQRRYPQFKFLIEGMLADMCHDVRHFDTPAYHCDGARNRIGYKVMDGISYDVVHGYRTAFACMHEAEAKAFVDPDAALRRALRLRIPCGQFSYASNIHPSCILGVSGTLAAVTEREWSAMTRYGLELYTDMPSVYGNSNFRFLNQAGDPITLVDSKADLFKVVTEQVRQKVKQNRAAIVFFKDPSALREYEASSQYEKVANKSVLREAQGHEEKEHIIRQAATVGQATFTSAVFGRGTDFFCSDPKLQEAGGVHVVQAFFSAEKTEEVQIKGRTARQGQRGTYSLVLLREELVDDFHVEPECLNGMSPASLYEHLDAARPNKRMADCDEMEKSRVQAEEQDALSHQYSDALHRRDLERSISLLHRLYDISRSEPLSRSRIVCLSDATGSMGGIWEKTRKYIQEMLTRIREIGGDNLDMQWVAYRDYSDGDGLLECSPMTSGPTVLQRFVDDIECYGGADPEEAIEHALAFAREQHGITRVILIGDAPPHRESKGEFLACHRRTLETDFESETEELARRGIPVDAFYVHDSARSKFQYIAEHSGGTAEPLGDAGQLIHAVCQSALEDIGGKDLVMEYKARYSTM